jgi:heat shock protein HtpX
MKTVRILYRVIRSWLSIVVAMAILSGFWLGCYLTVAYVVEQYPERADYLTYFEWGLYLAGGIGIITLVFNEWIVARMTQAYKVSRREINERLWDSVHRATPWYARPYPRIYVLPEGGMNAISFGWGLPFMSAVGATEGLINELTDEELDAVMAHEVGHIINKDILISTMLSISVMVMAFTGYMLLRLSPYTLGSRRSSSSSDSKGSGAWVILVVLLVGGIMYGVGRFLAVFLQMFVSRQREYATDALAVDRVGSPKGLISALEKITGGGSNEIGSKTIGTAAGFLCTADPDPSDMFSTHPDPYMRIRELEALG